MVVYRIAKKQFIYDLEGTGARIAGGRWNSKGYGMLYTSSSVSLAMLEVLVHFPVRLLPPDMVIAEIHIPDSLQVTEIIESGLSSDWRDFPPPDHLKEMGNDWIESMISPVLQVPSAVNAEEFNYLINPLHEDAKKIKILKIKEFRIDARLLKRT